MRTSRHRRVTNQTSACSVISASKRKEQRRSHRDALPWKLSWKLSRNHDNPLSKTKPRTASQRREGETAKQNLVDLLSKLSNIVHKYLTHLKFTQGDDQEVHGGDSNAGSAAESSLREQLPTGPQPEPTRLNLRPRQEPEALHQQGLFWGRQTPSNNSYLVIQGYSGFLFQKAIQWFMTLRW